MRGGRCGKASSRAPRLRGRSAPWERRRCRVERATGEVVRRRVPACLTNPCTAARRRRSPRGCCGPATASPMRNSAKPPAPFTAGCGPAVDQRVQVGLAAIDRALLQREIQRVLRQRAVLDHHLIDQPLLLRMGVFVAQHGDAPVAFGVDLARAADSATSSRRAWSARAGGSAGWSRRSPRRSCGRASRSRPARRAWPGTRRRTARDAGRCRHRCRMCSAGSTAPVSMSQVVAASSAPLMPPRLGPAAGRQDDDIRVLGRDQLRRRLDAEAHIDAVLGRPAASASG